MYNFSFSQDFSLFFRGDKFRVAFKELQNLTAYFPATPVLALSGSITTSLSKRLPQILGLVNPVRVELNPHRPNIFLKLVRKEQDCDTLAGYEHIFRKEIDTLYVDPDNYPVTLCFIPYQYMSAALGYCEHKFGEPNLDNSVYGALYSRQDQEVTDEILRQLKSNDPRMRLVFTSSVSGMGFDSPSVSNIIHTLPPRSISQYLQEIGRSGRCSQKSQATLHWCPSDIKCNLPGIKTDIQDYCKNLTCRWENLLSNFGFDKLPGGTSCDCCDKCKSECKCQKCMDEMQEAFSHVTLSN